MTSSDARRYKRVSLNLPARIVINVVDEFEGRLINISPGDMALISEAKTVVGDAAVIHIKALDVIEGTVARIFSRRHRHFLHIVEAPSRAVDRAADAAD